MKHIISLSGGIGSYESLKRVLKIAPKEDVICVFCDTLNENQDLYRFLNDIEKKLEIRIIRLVDGRTPFDLMEEQKFLFNSRVANCSKILKSKLFNTWLKENYKPNEAILYFGIDFTESNRKNAITRNYNPYEVRYPLCEKPYLYKYEMIENLKDDGIEIPELYRLGFPHNNCNGACVKAGIGQYKLLYEKNKEQYLKMEQFEIHMQEVTCKYVTILKRNGHPFSLKQLRMIIEHTPKQLTLDESCDYGACGCFVDDNI